MNSDFGSQLRSTTAGFVALTDEQVSLLERHYRVLCDWNRRLNLTRVTDLGHAIEWHYAESLFLAVLLSEIVPSRSGVADFGSGAGFPGVPVAVLRPDWNVALVESHARKSVFLREATRDLDNVSIINSRFEKLSAVHDVVISRAVDWKAVLEAAGQATTVAFLRSAKDAEIIFQLRSFTWNITPIPWNPDHATVIGRRRFT